MVTGYTITITCYTISIIKFKEFFEDSEKIRNFLEKYKTPEELDLIREIMIKNQIKILTYIKNIKMYR